MDKEQLDKIMKKYKDKKITPLRAIKLYCKELCCCGDLKSWKECTAKSCFLWQFRFGRKNIKRKQKQAEKTTLFPHSFSKNKPNYEKDVKENEKEETKD